MNEENLMDARVCIDFSGRERLRDCRARGSHPCNDRIHIYRSRACNDRINIHRSRACNDRINTRGSYAHALRHHSRELDGGRGDVGG